MDRLSYGQYGLVVIISAFIMSLVFGLIPHFIVLTIVYLFTRARFEEPIHAYGLNVCYVATMVFYALIFITIKICNQLVDEKLVFVMLVALVVLSTFATSTLPTKLEKIGKIFFGYKKDESKYQRLIDFIKFNGLNDKMADAWVKNMVPIGKHWTLEETTEAMNSMNYEDKEIDFFVVANMMYNDYYSLVKEDETMALKLAHEWLNDEDAKDSKLYEYWKYIVKRD